MSFEQKHANMRQINVRAFNDLILLSIHKNFYVLESHTNEEENKNTDGEKTYRVQAYVT